MSILERVETLTRVEGHNNFAASELRRALDGIVKLESVGDWDRLEVLTQVLEELLRVKSMVQRGGDDGFAEDSRTLEDGTGYSGLRVDAPSLPLGLALRRFLA